ncbi:MAG: YcgN family cysteine cluster protein [Parvularculaceae bacterium]|nr:YcgN family cysteine cluster protein [Parvularculaceae bacterium]
MSDRPFWEHKSLKQMSREEWESLCDGCGRCCLITLIDDDEPDIIAETSVHCAQFDASCRQCRNYEQRAVLVPNCVTLTPENVADLGFMPPTCAYRRLSEGKGLPNWHPLLTGRRESVAEAGVAVSPDLTDERGVDEDDLWRFITNERRRG